MELDIWKILGIQATKDKKAIKRAYAKQLKLHHPEEDPEGFQLLHEAYELALEQKEVKIEKVVQKDMDSPPPIPIQKELFKEDSEKEVVWKLPEKMGYSQLYEYLFQSDFVEYLKKHPEMEDELIKKTHFKIKQKEDVLLNQMEYLQLHRLKQKLYKEMIPIEKQPIFYIYILIVVILICIIIL
ncbi:DnaJ domain-containing protein [Floccifex sp.]|uniref:DnaJ domain-containing protein n=1 Tax=Floccifex sp. TaxID=2815810 RepID=UPI003F0C146B